MDSLINSFLLVTFAEIGDKTQLLSLLLATRFKKPWTILLGIFIATVVNHALAVWVGKVGGSLIPPHIARYVLAGIFFAFAFWVLVPDKEEGLSTKGHFGALGATIMTFFLAEMGDKTQLASVALGAKYQGVWEVTLGTTLGMLAANIPAVFMGEKIFRYLPLKVIRIVAALSFAAFGIFILLSESPSSMPALDF